MLSWSKIIKYCKGNLALPSTFLEEADQELIDWIKLTALTEFSTYFPDKERSVVFVNDSRYKADEHIKNKFYFFDEENLEILNIVECYFSLENEIMAGHPYFGPTNMVSAKWWALNVFKSKQFSKFMDWSYTYKFTPPNIVEVLPTAPSQNFIVEYERVQPEDLSRIPNALEFTFMDLSLAHLELKFGNLRSHYQDRITTPFGEIPLNGEELRNRGNDRRDKIIENFKEETRPPIVIEIY